MRAYGEARKRPAETILETVGLTPTLRLRRVAEGAPAAIYGKIDRFSPSGSVKYRIVPHIVKMAEQRGDLKPGMTIIEGSSGNTGITAAMAGAVKGYRVIIVMPDGMSEERRKAIRAYDVEVVLTPGGETDLDLVVQKVQKPKAENPVRMWKVGQFINNYNSL